MTLSAVLFDMDGLLVDTEPMWMRVELATVAELGGSWSPVDQAAILGSSMAHAASYIKDKSGTHRDPKAVADMLISGMLVELRGADIPIQPGAAELLTEVAASGIPYALVSASVRPIVDLVLAALIRAGLPSFPVSVAGDEVERGKPDPMPYLTAAATLGVDIARAVVLEDSANGVQSAARAGASVVAIPHAVPIAATDRIHVRSTLVGLDLAGLRALVPSTTSVHPPAHGAIRP